MSSVVSQVLMGRDFKGNITTKNIKLAVLCLFRAHSAILSHNQEIVNLTCFINAVYVKYELKELFFCNQLFLF